jgi:WD40 repeat protein
MTEQEALTLVETLLHSAKFGQGLNNIQSVVFLETWAGRSYRQIAAQLGYEYDYIRQVGSRLWQLLSQTIGEKVSKSNIHTVLRRYQQGMSSSVINSERSTPDWGEANEVSQFYGRHRELQILETWAIGDRCRFIGIFGLGGIGKTAISVKLAQKVQSQFESVIWRSLQQAPPLNTILSDILSILAGKNASADISISALIEQLRQKRCLLILDNVESILLAGNSTGAYQSGYDAYRQLFERIGDESHQSCLILTGREKPGEIAMREGKKQPVRSLQLLGISVAESQKILFAKGLEATLAQNQILVNYFGGNPLALKIAATTIQILFGGNIEEFLAQGTTVFSNLWDLLEQQFERLSKLQQKVMYWLAINREAVMPAKLQKEILPKVPLRELLETLEALNERSLVESQLQSEQISNPLAITNSNIPNRQSITPITQQPVIMEYVTERLIRNIEQEIVKGELNLFKTHTLIEAQTQDYVREAQIQLILQPLTERLLTHFETQDRLEEHLCKILASLRHESATQTGYAGGNLLNLFCHLKIDFRDFDFSHLVIRQAYLANAVLQNVNFSSADISQTVFAETFGGVLGVAFSPDGERLATSDSKGQIQIWDTRSGEQLVCCRGHQHWTWAIAFSPDGNYLASASDDYSVKLWEVETGECLQTYQGHTYSVNAVAFSPDGEMIASCSQDLTIRLWRVVPAKLNSETEILTLLDHSGRVWDLAFSPDGRTLASCGEDCTIRLWDIETGTCYCIWKAHDRWVRSVAFSPDGQLLASSSYDQTIKLWKLWDIRTQHCLKTFQGHRQPVTAISFSPDGRQLVSSSFDRTLKLWEVTTGECLKTFIGHNSRVWKVAYHPNGQQIVSGGDDHATKVWNLKTGRCTKTFKGHTNAVLDVALSPDRCYLASGHEDQTVRVWDLKSGTLVQTLREHTNRVWALAFQPASQGSILASGSADYTIKLWDWQLGKCLQTLSGHNSWVWSVAFSPNGTQLASGSYDQTVKLWDIGTGRCLKTLQGHTSPVLSVAFNPKGKILASSDFDGMIKLWNLESEECFSILKGHANSVWYLAFRAISIGDRDLGSTSTGPTEQLCLLSASFDKTIKLWSLLTGECLKTFEGHQGPTVTQFSPDGKFIVSGSWDRTVKVWNISTGECEKTLTGHSEAIMSLVVAPVQLEDEASARLAAFTTSLDESIKIWDLQDNECKQTLIVPRPYEGMKIKGIQGLSQAQCMTLKALGAVD